jgi:hypothetical protein
MKIGSEKPKFYGSVDSKQVSWNSEGKQPSKNSGKPKESAKEEARKQEQALREIMAFGRPNGANRAYGGGETITSTTTGGTGKAGEINYQSGGGAVVGQNYVPRGKGSHLPNENDHRSRSPGIPGARRVWREVGRFSGHGRWTGDLGRRGLCERRRFCRRSSQRRGGAGFKGPPSLRQGWAFAFAGAVPVCTQAPKGALSALA